VVKVNRKFVTFGEVMVRLSPSGCLGFVQTRSLDAIHGSGEANVAVALANFWIPVDYVTRLPPNDIGDACLNYIRQFVTRLTLHIQRFKCESAC